ncbi:polysaccharide deacetylase family protein [Streptomyces coelicoflavus]|uniref:polysaccharide deacetylase family protein n=1 Tax=Streptomyces coelicoflavus TaxID=285562 RepID=UPI0036A4C89A
MAATRRMASHRMAARAVVAAVCAASLAGCAIDNGSGSGEGPQGSEKEKGKAAPAPKNAVRLIGDGSTAYTGAQPHLPRPERLKPGQKPPQFVVFSWDGAGEDSQKLFSHFREVAKENNATMTFFLSGVYMLPTEKRDLYSPPQHSPGRSDIGFNDEQGIADTVKQLRLAWQEGNEIGTHFNGHFCGANGGVGEWSVEEWKEEIKQAKQFVKTWKTNTGMKNAAPLPFDYDKELIGARTPCLEGQKNFVKAASQMGFRYDSSGVNNQVWPAKKEGLWDLSMQLVPFPGHSYEQLTMDYNYMVNQSGSATQGDPAKREFWGDQMRDSLLKGFERAYDGNRAPLIIGNHFESWNGGTYMRAVEEVVETVCNKEEVRCVSFRQLADWLDAQDPKVLKKLRTLGVGEAPEKGWASFLSAAPAPAPKGVPGAPAAKP